MLCSLFISFFFCLCIPLFTVGQWNSLCSWPRSPSAMADFPGCSTAHNIRQRYFSKSPLHKQKRPLPQTRSSMTKERAISVRDSIMRRRSNRCSASAIIGIIQIRSSVPALRLGIKRHIHFYPSVLPPSLGYYDLGFCGFAHVHFLHFWKSCMKGLQRSKAYIN